MTPSLTVTSVQRRRLVVFLLAMAGCAYEGQRTPHSVQSDYLRSLAPADLEIPPARAGVARTFPVRVHVDAEYRSRIRWRSELSALFERANEVLEPTFGVRMKVAEVREWERRSPASDPKQMLAELAKLDEGRDVAWVFGMTAALPIATANIEALGAAELLSKHAICRAMDDGAEALELHKALTALSEDRIDATVSQRARHKALVVLLHEWGHTLGVPHALHERSVMNPLYKEMRSAFGAEAEVLVGASLEHVRARPSTYAERSAMDAAVEKVVRERAQGFDPADREELLQFIAERRAHAQEAQAQAKTEEAVEASQARAPGNQGLTQEESDALNAVLEKPEEAWRLAEPLARRLPDDFATQLFACQSSARTKAAESARWPCDRAIELKPKDPEPWAALGWVLAKARKLVDGAEALQKAAECAEKEEAATPARVWDELGRLARELGAVSLAETVAPHCPTEAGARLSAWAQSTRRRTGLRPEQSPGRLHEGLYRVTYEAILASFEAGRTGEASKSVATALERFPGAPGLLALQCGLVASTGLTGEARPLCERALAGYEPCVQAHYFLGLLDKVRRNGRGKAADHLRRVIALAPELRSAWVQLGEVLLVDGKAQERAELQRQYQARFGKPLLD
ncbi:MAG TPA: M12 family metallo-peptidase [Myxococcales bacterium]|jgi:tetratricopeptide (TPR) repeat protein